MGGVSEPTPSKGHGGKRNVNLELNLVPFIDLLVVCITFLLLTAVWTQTGQINIDQTVQKPKQKQEQKEPPKVLNILIDEKGFALNFTGEPAQHVPKGAEGYNFEGLKAKLKEMKERAEKNQKVIVAPEDKVLYFEMIKVVDTCSSLDLPNIMIADASSVMAQML
ncbi:MAG: biopolymer transporter ExbD [Deltaproteobacteria bacterium]|nr:biopolymer transporter ExbD [Deltaproteobacteria bacterium]